MDEAIPSRTALRVALRRAAHQMYDSPLVFCDPIAVPILGERYAEELRRTPLRADRPFSTALRAHMVARSRYAEDNLRLAYSAGVRQYVLLGAGLDTFAYRNQWPDLRVFEVDHPATQEWKRQLLAAGGISVPENLTYAAVDFERQSLAKRLAESRFDRSAPAFFAWLGVVPYLTLEAFRDTVSFIASQPHAGGVALDYGLPRSVLPPLEQMGHDSLASRVRLAGEPFQLFFTPEEIAVEFAAFSRVEDIGASEINRRYFSDRKDQLRVLGSAGRLMSAWV